MIQVIHDIEAGTAESQAQPETGDTYAKKILKSEANIDWQDTALNIRSKIHAFNPDPICSPVWSIRTTR